MVAVNEPVPTALTQHCQNYLDSFIPMLSVMHLVLDVRVHLFGEIEPFSNHGVLILMSYLLQPKTRLALAIVISCIFLCA